MAADPVARFSAIDDGLEEDLKTLRAVIAHIDGADVIPLTKVVMLNSTLVAITTAVEEKIRELLSEYLSILEESHSSHKDLPHERNYPALAREGKG